MGIGLGVFDFEVIRRYLGLRKIAKGKRVEERERRQRLLPGNHSSQFVGKRSSAREKEVWVSVLSQKLWVYRFFTKK